MRHGGSGNATMPYQRTSNVLLIGATSYSRALHLIKKISNKYWSVRVGLDYRVLGVEVENGISWFWIGTHAEYDQLLGN